MLERVHSSGRWQWQAAILFALAVGTHAEGRQETSPPSAPSQPSANPVPPGSGLDRLLTQVVLENIPHSYTDDKDWGKTTRRWNGVRLRREGWKWETKRDWVDVNHGLWQRYTVRLLNPDSRFAVSVSDLRPTTGTRTEFDLTVITPLALEARQSQWVNGLQLYSLSAEADCKIRLTVHCDLGWTIDHSRQPPAVIIDPRITKADLDVDDFRVRNISKVGGEVAQQATKWVRSRLDEEVQQRETKLVKKLNRDIERHRADLSLPLDEIAHFKWLEGLSDSKKSRDAQEGSQTVTPSGSAGQ